jgi:hypothetical protein
MAEKVCVFKGRILAETFEDLGHIVYIAVALTAKPHFFPQKHKKTGMIMFLPPEPPVARTVAISSSFSIRQDRSGHNLRVTR